VNAADALPVVFLALMGAARLACVVLDGYDPGVGMLLPAVERPDEDRMIASIGLPQPARLLPIPLVTAAALLAARARPTPEVAASSRCRQPFARVVGVFVLGALGLAYSLFPFVGMDRPTIREAASAPEALAVIAIGCAITVPAIVGYTILSHRIFRGKARPLDYVCVRLAAAVAASGSTRRDASGLRHRRSSRPAPPG
jgi:cytochrome bd-type quinol oxidase subunit 2